MQKSLLPLLCVILLGLGAGDARGTDPCEEHHECGQDATNGYGCVLGTFRGVDAQSNGGWTGGACGDYQCVAYVKHFYRIEVEDEITESWGIAADAYDLGDDGLDNYPNDGTTIPAPGDVICFDDDSYGHVAICTEVGTSYIKIIDQNRTASSANIVLQLAMDVNDGHYHVHGFGQNEGYAVEGWMRDPDYTPATYVASYVSQTPTDPSGVLQLQPNEVVNCSFTFRNTGTAYWTNDGGSSHYVELHSVNSSWTQDQASSLARNWISGSQVRIATTTGRVDPPSGTGLYSFQIQTPTTPGNYTLYVALYHPNSSQYISGTGPKIEIEVVSPPPPPADPGFGLTLVNPLTGDWYVRISDTTSFVTPDGPNTPTDRWEAGWAIDGQSYTFERYTGDPNGDGYDDLIVHRNDGRWFVAWNNLDGSFTGSPNYLVDTWIINPAPGAYFHWFLNLNSTPSDELLTFDVVNGVWTVFTFNPGIMMYEYAGVWASWGAASIGTFQPVVGDWNGDTKWDILLRNWSTGHHFVRLSNGTSFYSPNPDLWITWGAVGTPAELVLYAGDWGGDGKTDLLLRNPSTGHWYVRFSSGSGFVMPPDHGPDSDRWLTGWAIGDFVVFTGDFDLDGKDEVGVRNIALGHHHVRLSDGIQFYEPVPENWCPSWGYGPTVFTLLTGHFGGVPLQGMAPQGGPGISVALSRASPELQETAVTENPATSTLALTPNPASTYLQLALPSGAAEMERQIRIIDAGGREALSARVGPHTVSSQIDISGLATGIYFVHISSMEDRHVYKLLIIR